MLHITNDDQNTKKVFTDLLKIIDSYWLKAEFMTDNDIINYKNIWEKNKQKIDSLEGAYSKSRNSISMVKSNTYSLTWEQYYKKISNDQLKSFQSRLDVLQKINNYFIEYQVFSKFSVELRKRVAGLMKDQELDWKLFGSMSRAYEFYDRINKNDIHISRSLDFIPLKGTIAKSDYEKFVKEFKRAFPDGGAGVAIASRMLSMKRPDYFICVDSENKTPLYADFGIPQNVKFETYWDHIISRILDSVWWSSPRPSNPIELQAWKGRVALID